MKEANCYDIKYLQENFKDIMCEHCPKYNYHSEYCECNLIWDGNICDFDLRDEEIENSYCIEAYETMMKENGEKNMENLLNLNVSLDGIIDSIKTEVKGELRNELKREVTSEITKEIKQEFFKTNNYQNENNLLYKEIKEYAQQSIKEIIDDYIKNNTVIIGDGWRETKQEMSIEDFFKEEVKKAIDENTISIDRQSYSFKDYIVEKCVTNELKRYMDKELKSIQKDVEQAMKSTFDNELKHIINEVAFKSMLATSEYKELTEKLRLTTSK